MTTDVAKLFSERDRALIADAVHAAEFKTSGEIVPYVVARSDQYEDAEWRGAFLIGFLAFIGFTIVRSFTEAWVPLDIVEIAVITLFAGALGMLAVRFVPGVKRFIAARDLITRRVEQRAAEAFVSEEVFNTKERTGILIFVSLLERRVLVVGDTGINARVAKGDWEGVVQRVVAGIKAGRPADGLVDAIGVCGALLDRHGVTRRSDDRDELSDDLRTRSV